MAIPQSLSTTVARRRRQTPCHFVTFSSPETAHPLSLRDIPLTGGPSRGTLYTRGPFLSSNSSQNSNFPDCIPPKDKNNYIKQKRTAASSPNFFYKNKKAPTLQSRQLCLSISTFIKRWFLPCGFNTLLNENFVCNFISSSVGFNPRRCFLRLTLVFRLRFGLSLGRPFHRLLCFLSAF